ncbi:MAG: hydroxymethylbilane synthase [Verrucomicrobiota bacterium]|nr:hydroxymethylbilane synthase [Verrucomicrobiota bacterium]
MRRSLVIGTRGSALALAQSSLAETALRAAHPDIAVEVKTITTSGDRRVDFAALQASGAGAKGLFTKEIEIALADGQIDVAVHSAKDLPGQAGEGGLTIAAVLPRANPRDVLISKNAASFSKLAGAARIGTSSVRRKRQLLWLRPDLEIVEMRGNVPTRIEKLRAAETLDGIVLARAGLDRLALNLDDLFMSELEIFPAAGQGIVALQARADDTTTIALLKAINHAPSFTFLRAEREFLRLLDGDCNLPVGVESIARGSRLEMKAITFRDDETKPRRAEADGEANDPEAVASRLFERLSN